MSRYVSVGLEVRSGPELEQALESLDLCPERAEGVPTPLSLAPPESAGMLMLEGSLECAGEPVHLRFEAGTLGTVEDFGLRLGEGGPVLVCGEYDTKLLERELLAPLMATIAQQRLARAGQRTEVVREADGTIRIVVDES